MQSKKGLRSRVWRESLLILMISMLPNLVLAQDSNQTGGKDKSSAQEPGKGPETEDAKPASPIGASWADSYFHQIGSSGLLAGHRQGVGWGSLYIPTAGVIGYVDRFEGTNTVPGTTFTATVFQATVVYDHKIGNSRLALQYAPSLAIAEGRVVSNFSNQNSNIEILIYSRPRWNVMFNDQFSYYYTQQSFGFPYFDVNPETSRSLTNNFLDGPSRWLSNTAYLSAGHALSARSSISITPNYIFSESGEGASLRRGSSYSGTVNWSYRTSERQTVGLLYTGQLIREITPATAVAKNGTTTDTVFHTLAATTERQLMATLIAHGSLGVTTSALANTQRQWFTYANFGLVKQLGRATAGLNYSRGDTLSSGLISNLYSDRIDLTYQSQLIKRLDWGVGGGYLRQVQSGGFSGWYTSGNVRFLLAPRAGLYATFDFSHKNQSGNTNNLFNGNRDIFAFGIRWLPNRVPN
jgi:hypothetical protein